MFRTPVLVFVAAFLWLAVSSPAAGDQTVVTTYVTKVQQERRSTRWTLTEWLRIKERMRMMDVWLAMFSSPKKETFRPELSLEWGQTRGQLSLLADDTGEEKLSDIGGSKVHAELWLTNLISGTTGLRTLNIDLGIDGSMRDGGTHTLISPAALQTDEIAATPAGTSLFQYYGGNLRIFGKSTQDTSLVLKAGQFDLNTSWLSTEVSGAPSRAAGRGTGAALSFYLLHFLGAEAEGMQYQATSLPAEITALDGLYYDYHVFIEVSLLRLMVGRYQEEWTFERQGSTSKSTEQGLLAGLKLQL